MTLFDCAEQLALRVPTSCGRTGRCHECVVEVTRGHETLAPRTGDEAFLRGGYRLACQAELLGAPSAVEFALLRRAPKILTETAPSGPVECDGRSGYGLAIDLGTTTVVLEVLDLKSGRVIYQSAFDNPQRFGGSDVMHRISYDGGPFQGELQRAAIGAVNAEIRDFSVRLGIDRREIVEAMVAGNTTMRDLFFGLDVQPIGQRPYKSITEARETTVLEEPAHRLGILAHPRARIMSPPLVGSHVGADTAAALVAIGIETARETVMLVDVGTNTEVVVGNAERMLAASCPAGPAFEGGLVRYGMPAGEGAIESAAFTGGGWEYQVIGGGEPRGICGSGLVDILAELRRHGRMTPLGVFAGKLRETPIAPEFGIALSREDVSNLAQAKAANFCGQAIVMRKAGAAPGAISKLYLAGGFAHNVDPGNAVEIGFLAPVPAERIVKTGNASLQGARELLLSERKRKLAAELARRIEHVELETEPDFFDLFVEGCQFKPMPSRI
jgi:uncharacterized 2Fe-2S/4Fe-4S cluster protein (DUF4445 family)